MSGIWPTDAISPVGLELGTRRARVENLADVDTAGDEFLARSLNVRNDQVETMGRSRRSGCHFRAKLD